tara:strand:- start:276 stop:1727 length:1452 start_codon:yes stop_codon:yes gene_type:complete
MATLERDILDRVGKYNLSELEIISYRQDKDESNPKTMDIKGITLTMSITEDIFSNNMNGMVTVYDTQDIRSIFPLTGLERLSLKLNTPGLPGLDYTHDNGVPFQIYKVDSVRKDTSNDIGQFYNIFFCSPEMYNNQISTVSRAYAGPIEVAVKDIFRNKKYLNSKKTIFIEDTKTNAKYVIPSLKPFSAINFLSSQALSGKYNNAGYLFYETSTGFHFRSLESMLAMGGSVARPTRWNFQTQITQVKDTKKDEVKDIQKRMQQVIRYEFGKQVDALENIRNGLYANRLVVHDAFNKTIKTHDFNYKDNYEKSFHLESIGDEQDADKHITPNTPLNDTGKGLYDFAESKKMVVTETSKVHNDYEFVPVNDTLPKITSQNTGYRNMNMTLLVYGNTLLNAGDVVNFTVPVMQPGESAIPNPYTSGRYLIMAIKHTIAVTTNNHTMVLKCMKDSVRTPYPREEDALITGKDDINEINIYKEDIIEL